MTDIAQKLVEKARTGKQKECEDLLKQQADVLFAEPPYERSALWHAAWKGFESVCRLLIDKGSNVNHKDREGRTALHEAAFYGRINIATLLLDRGADINIKDKKGRTPIFRAVEGKRTEMVHFLMGRGCEMNFVCQDPDEQTELTVAHLAAFGGNPRLDHFLYFSGAWHNRYSLHDRRKGLETRRDWFERRRREKERAAEEERWRQKQKRLAEGKGEESDEDDDNGEDNLKGDKKRKLRLKQLKAKLFWGSDKDSLAKRRDLWQKWDLNKDDRLSVAEAVEGLTKHLKLNEKGQKIDKAIVLRAFKHAAGHEEEDEEDLEEKEEGGGEVPTLRVTNSKGDLKEDEEDKDGSDKGSGGSQSGTSIPSSAVSSRAGSRRGSFAETETKSVGGANSTLGKTSRPGTSRHKKGAVVTHLLWPQFRRFLYLVTQYFMFHELFKDIDTDGTMSIDIQEFSQASEAMKEVGCFIRDPVAEFAQIDTDKSGCLSFMEFCEFCWRNSLDLPFDDNYEPDDQTKKIIKGVRQRKRMNVLDNLPKNERWDALMSMIPAGKDAAKARAKLFADLDSGKGRGANLLTYSELWGNLRKKFRGMQLPGCLNLSWPVKAAFEAARMSGGDKENESRLERMSLSRPEFRAFCEYLRVFMTLFRMFENLDTSGEGRLDFDEFQQGWSQMYEWGFRMEGTCEENFREASQMGQGKKDLSALEFFNWALKQPLDISFESDPDQEEETEDSQSAPANGSSNRTSPEPPADDEKEGGDGEQAEATEGATSGERADASAPADAGGGGEGGDGVEAAGESGPPEDGETAGDPGDPSGAGGGEGEGGGGG
uniref:EF-hand domain-containing protein n=1 Tax=Chromera velia CCMP2878 TaxID=1169474 RepID=A0A0G4FN03_9ALVE|eukprot:Cvel_3533.t1-p1 / transcript=Cvel_3533.t1 / gene=Cvel_3533 / organism=Chromera_velia_CCMP2878 / gene_product=Flagellar calcium-binding protein TB-44A, putative / transcript_product=Flagellar calcium-binding protein TB-44A, putative / location=Cvel_scaffold144:10799-19077(+) / protein_length=824 / sequence_SO=supercontig / SO=protein_coding / is_pseudo=false